mmetsp:Transcript_5884/g.12390  ORF Transcript_5884/g.12390 Transcript_5884/m.12390 type:complete len:87 (-) Transcript_5884:247-507(-)
MGFCCEILPLYQCWIHLFSIVLEYMASCSLVSPKDVCIFFFVKQVHFSSVIKSASGASEKFPQGRGAPKGPTHSSSGNWNASVASP